MLGENIYNLRKSKKLSQEELAELVRVTRQTISNWELGSTQPNPEQLKLLSISLGVSIDELLNNDIQNVLIERVSNTEKLAGIIIKILKFIGIAFIILLIIDVISFIVYYSQGKITNIESSATIVCEIEDKSYEIEFGTDKNFKCDNCMTNMKEEIKKVINFDDLGNSVNNIEQYFISNGGSCE